MRFMRQRALWLLTGFIMVAALLGGLALYRPFDSAISVPIAPENGPNPPTKLPGKLVTFLVMGVDKRPDDAGRSDSMIVVSYNPASDQLAILSLPRDTWVEIPGHGYDKVNHSYAYGGERLAVQVVQKLLGINIDHFVTISFQGFREIVDEVGGVQVDAEKRMLYHDPYDTAMGPEGLVIDIQPGLQHMDGLTALKYSRYRMDDEGDIGRMRRQQQVIKALLKAAATPAIVGRIPQLIPAFSHAVVSDLSVAEMIKLAVGAKDALGHPLRTGTLGGTTKTIDGVFYLIPELVAERTTAYQMLVGESPSGEFLRRAQEDQAAYAAALTAQIEQEDRKAVTATETGSPAPTSGEAAPPAGAGTTANATPPGTGAKTPRPPATGGKQTRPTPVTVALIDASGKNLGAVYANKLRAANFRIARMGRASEPIPHSTALDHAGQPSTLVRLQQIIPGLTVVSMPDKNAGEAVQIVLGADLNS